MSDEKYDIMTIWIPLIGAFIMFVAVLIIGNTLDNDFHSETGLRLFEPGFVVLLGIVLSVVMFFFFRSSGKKKKKAVKAEEKNVENGLQFMRKQHTTKEKRYKGKRRSRQEKQRSREEKQAYESLNEPEKA